MAAAATLAAEPAGLFPPMALPHPGLPGRPATFAPPALRVIRSSTPARPFGVELSLANPAPAAFAPWVPAAPDALFAPASVPATPVPSTRQPLPAVLASAPATARQSPLVAPTTARSATGEAASVAATTERSAVRNAAAAFAVPGVWKGDALRAAGPMEASGLPSLDELLQGGWPLGALTQIATPHKGLGLALLLPVLARLTQAGRHVGLVAPPWIPYAPALATGGVVLERLLWLAPAHQPFAGGRRTSTGQGTAPGPERDALWSTEQMLRSGVFGAVLFWTGALDGRTERRLQLAAQEGGSLAVSFRHDAEAVTAPSFAALRLQLAARAGEVEVTVSKARSARPGRSLCLPLQLSVPGAPTVVGQTPTAAASALATAVAAAARAAVAVSASAPLPTQATATPAWRHAPVGTGAVASTRAAAVVTPNVSTGASTGSAAVAGSSVSPSPASARARHNPALRDFAANTTASHRTGPAVLPNWHAPSLAVTAAAPLDGSTGGAAATTQRRTGNAPAIRLPSSATAGRGRPVVAAIPLATSTGG